MEYIDSACHLKAHRTVCRVWSLRTIISIYDVVIAHIYYISISVNIKYLCMSELKNITLLLR